MLIIPAIDIKDGKVVRLTQGSYEKVTVYSSDPIKVAQNWQIQGAKLLHIVDLDGALEGKPKNLDIVAQISKNISIPIEFGGGIRTKNDVEDALAIGVSFVILGTKATEDLDLIRDLVSEFGTKIMISIDSKFQMVAKQGWTKPTTEKAPDLALKIQEIGVRRIVCTDISKDGTLQGLDLNIIKQFIEKLEMDVIISGGVSGLDDIAALNNLKSKPPFGVIVGKALYENRFDLKQAISLISRG